MSGYLSLVLLFCFRPRPSRLWRSTSQSATTCVLGCAAICAVSTAPLPPTPMCALWSRPFGELARSPEGRMEKPAKVEPDFINFLREVLG
ncbi:MAG: hypothetical protein ACJ0KA_04610 [Verrucomicrobiales bacterium]